MKLLSHLLCLAVGWCLVSCNEGAENHFTVPQQNQFNLTKDADATRLAGRAYRHTETILSFGHRQPQSRGLRQTKSYLKSQLAQYGWQAVEQSFEAKTPKGTMQFSNIIARYAPKESQNPWIRNTQGLLCAHIDSKILPHFLGADDAASSAGAILAIAEYLHHHYPNAAKSLELVFFDGEEAIDANIVYGKDGLYGSIRYARDLQIAHAKGLAPYKRKPRFGILLDMIGHKDLQIAIPSDTPRQLAVSYKKARKMLGYEKHFGFSSSSIIDDHVPLNEIAKVPTIDIIGRFNKHAWWHTPNDNLDLISPKSLKMSIQLTLEILTQQL